MYNFLIKILPFFIIVLLLIPILVFYSQQSENISNELMFLKNGTSTRYLKFKEISDFIKSNNSIPTFLKSNLNEISTIYASYFPISIELDTDFENLLLENNPAELLSTIDSIQGKLHFFHNGINQTLSNTLVALNNFLFWYCSLLIFMFLLSIFIVIKQNRVK